MIRNVENMMKYAGEFYAAIIRSPRDLLVHPRVLFGPYPYTRSFLPPSPTFPTTSCVLQPQLRQQQPRRMRGTFCTS